MKKILSLLIIFCSAVIAQPKSHFRFNLPLLAEINSFSSDSVNNVFYVYRVPSNSFVFVKEGSYYSAHFRLTVEVSDSSSNYINRQVDEKKIFANNFDETNSKNYFEEGVFVFKLKAGTYKFLPIIEDLNSQQEIRLHPEIKNIGNKKGNHFLEPIVVNNNGNNKSDLFNLTNYAGNFPFSEEKYNLIIPCTDTSVNKIHVVLINNLDTVFTGNISDSFVGGLGIKEKFKSMIISKDTDSTPTRNFILSDFSNKLNEGKLAILLSDNSNKKNIGKFEKRVIWYSKPFSLFDTKKAIQFLDLIAKQDVVDELLNGDEKELKKNLFNYWKKLDPTPNTAFNPLMEEYYSRIDYALKHFYTMSRKRDLLNDMSKIYIKYGKPFKKERTYNKYGKLIETWFYKKPDVAFNFIDPNGFGDFILLKNNE